MHRVEASDGRADATRQSRTDRFLCRIDRHLPTLPDRASRCAFLDGQLAGWEHRYACFVGSEGASEPAREAEPVQAADFLMTITGLAARRRAAE
ncbi:MAG: hypothetical protein ACJ8F3_08525 [Xanthobacteraceae bacterium]